MWHWWQHRVAYPWLTRPLVWRTDSRRLEVGAWEESSCCRVDPSDWCGGGWRSVGGCHLWWVSRVAHVSSQVGGSRYHIRKSWGSTAYQGKSRCTCHGGWLRLDNDPSMGPNKERACMRGGKEICQNAARLTHSLSSCHLKSGSVIPVYTLGTLLPGSNRHFGVQLCWFKITLPHSSMSYRLNIETDTPAHLFNSLPPKSKRNTYRFTAFWHVLYNWMRLGIKRLCCNTTGTANPSLHQSFWNMDNAALIKSNLFEKQTQLMEHRPLCHNAFTLRHWLH